MHPNRRTFIAGLGGAAAWPLLARAREQMRHIGVLQPGSDGDAESQQRRAAFVAGLPKLGWSEGSNVLIHDRWTGDDGDHMRLGVTELIGLRPDLICTSGGLPLLLFKRATAPFRSSSAPFTIQLVAGSSPTSVNPALKQIAPEVSRVAVLLNLEQPPHVAMWRPIEATAPLLGVHATPADAPSADEIERVIKAFAHEPNGGLIVLPSHIVHFASRLPRWRRGIAFRLPSHFASTSPAVAWCRMASIPPSKRGKRPVMLIASSMARSPAICRYSNRPNSSCDQPQDRKGTWARHSDFATRTRRRGDRIAAPVAAVHESGSGPKRRLRDVCYSAAVGG